MKFVDLVSVFPIATRLSLLYISIIYRNPDAIAMFLSIMFGTGIEKIFKSLPYPKAFRSYTKRPYLARNCNSFSNDGRKPSRAPGFPSGHMTSTTMFAMWNMLLAYEEERNNIGELIRNRPLNVTINVLIIIAMAYARLSKKCHTPFQVTVGFLLGLTLSIVTFRFYQDRIKPSIEKGEPLINFSVNV